MDCQWVPELQILVKESFLFITVPLEQSTSITARVKHEIAWCQPVCYPLSAVCSMYIEALIRISLSFRLVVKDSGWALRESSLYMGPATYAARPSTVVPS